MNESVDFRSDLLLHHFDDYWHYSCYHFAPLSVEADSSPYWLEVTRWNSFVCQRHRHPSELVAEIRETIPQNAVFAIVPYA